MSATARVRGSASAVSLAPMIGGFLFQAGYGLPTVRCSSASDR
jgi:hypothetical protein